MVPAPIFHVNGDDPEACVRVARLAFEYRQRWHKDVVIDMVCYRRHGHNEGDDPSYTQPVMYRRIDAKRSVRKIYTEPLVKRGDISIEEAEEALDDFQSRLQTALDETKQAAPPSGTRAQAAPPALGVLPHVETGIAARDLRRGVSTRSTPRPRASPSTPSWPSSSRPRAKMVRDDGEVDWATGEALAFGSLLYEGTSVRLAGEDSRRGTFSQRHAVLVDYETGAEHTPLETLARDGSHFWLYDSLLSEFAALGFEYGYSVENKDALVDVGGAVRRLRQRRPGHHRPVHRRRRGQVGPDLRPGHAPAPRLRGPGARALLGPHRALPHARRRGQHPGRATPPPRRSTSTCCAAR